MDLAGFRAWILEDPATRVPLTLILLGVTLVLPLFGLAAYLWRIAARIDRHRLPPRTVRLFAFFFAFAAVALIVMLWRFAAFLAPRISS